MRLFLLAFTFLLTQASFGATPTTRLLLVGGGADRPPEAMKLLANWSGGTDAKILIIGWASEIPEDYFGTISADLRAQGAGDHFLAALKAPTTEAEKDLFLANLNTATGVFLSGGNQNRAMKVIEDWNLKEAFVAKFQSGTPFAGTSAGTAMMADSMITGNEGAMIGKGLGFFKKGVIDMHFLKRNREARLLSAMKDAHLDYGIGVDEDGAVAILNSEDAKVVGEKHVVFYHQNSDGSVDRNELENQATFNTKAWSPAVSCPWSISEAP